MNLRLPRGAHLYLVDAAAGVVWTVVYAGFALSEKSDGQPSFTGPAWLGLLVAAAVGLPLALRRRWPIPVLCVVLAGMVAATLLDVTREPFSAVTFALYLVALKETQRRAVAALAGSLLVVGVTVLLSFVGGPEPAWGEPVLTGMFVWLWSGAGWAAGFVVRARRAAAVRDSAHRADQALADERLRIARELHDVVAHSMSLIAVKAAVGNHVAGERPDEARDALRVIEATSRDALVEMRRLLGVLRSGKDGAELGPAPGPGGLADLARRAELGGVAVDLDVHGAGDLPEGVGLSLYRIVQESLTNVVKHAAGARCRVAVGTKGTLVRIEVTDDGPGGLPRGSGHGLIGMRERVMMYGGEFTAGPRPEGGFRVLATLPFEPSGSGEPV